MDHTVCMHVFTALSLRWNDIGEDEEEELSLRKQTHPCTCDKFEAFLLTCTEEWMSQKIWKETKHLPGTAEQGNILCCCLVSLSFLRDIHSIHSVASYQDFYLLSLVIPIIVRHLVNPTPSHGTACLPFSLGRRESVKNVHLCNRVGLNPQKQVAIDHRSFFI